MYLARVLCRVLTADFNLLAWLVGGLTPFFLSGTWPFSAFSKCRHWRGARTKRRGFSRRMPRERRSKKGGDLPWRRNMPQRGATAAVDASTCRFRSRPPPRLTRASGGGAAKRAVAQQQLPETIQ